MSDGSISIKLAPDYEMGAVQKQVENYGQGEDLVLNDLFSHRSKSLIFAIKHAWTAQSQRLA